MTPLASSVAAAAVSGSHGNQPPTPPPHPPPFPPPEGVLPPPPAPTNHRTAPPPTLRSSLSLLPSSPRLPLPIIVLSRSGSPCSWMSLRALLCSAASQANERNEEERRGTLRSEEEERTSGHCCQACLFHLSSPLLSSSLFSPLALCLTVFSRRSFIQREVRPSTWVQPACMNRCSKRVTAVANERCRCTLPFPVLSLSPLLFPAFLLGNVFTLRPAWL